MGDQNKPQHEPNGGPEHNPDGTPPKDEVALAMAAEAMQQNLEDRVQLMIEQRVRQATDLMFQHQLGHLAAQTQRLEERVDERLRQPAPQLTPEQQELLARMTTLAARLTGPQELLEGSRAVPAPLQTTAPIARPHFTGQRANWELPRIQPPGFDTNRPRILP